MQVGALMRRSSQQAERTTPITDIARMMGENGARAVAVEEHGRFVGVITDWDISCRLVITGGEIGAATAGDLMDSAQLRCGADTELAQAIAMMDRAGARCLAVTDQRQRLLGTLHRHEVPRAAA